MSSVYVEVRCTKGVCLEVGGRDIYRQHVRLPWLDGSFPCQFITLFEPVVALNRKSSASMHLTASLLLLTCLLT